MEWASNHLPFVLMRWILCFLGPIVFKVDGSIACCHHTSYSHNDHLLSGYLLSDRTCVRCLTHLVSNSLNPARQGAVMSHSHFIGKGAEALSIEISS